MQASRNVLAWSRIRRGARLTPVFQPIVSLSHGHVVAYEALSRPSDRAGRPLSILDVVGSAQAAGPTAEVELDVMAIDAIVGRASGLCGDTMLFVNVSPFTLLDRPQALSALSPLAGRVVLEVTERTLIPDHRSADFRTAIESVRAKGMQVAMDDCGAGYSGLTRLVQVRPDFAKVDLDLVRDVDRDSAKAHLVEALVVFCRRAGISVVAEGVETTAERDVLGALGVGYAQGFLMARPAPSFLPVDPMLGRAESGVAAGADVAASLGALGRLARMALRGLDEGPGLYEAIVHAARDGTGADTAVLRRRIGQTLEPVAASGAPERPEAVALALDSDVARAFRSGRTVVRQTPEPGASAASGASAVCAPIRVGAHRWGILSVGFARPDRVRADHVDLTSSLADHVGLVLAASRWTHRGSGTATVDALRYLVDHPGDLSDFLARLIHDLERATGSHDCWIGTVRGDRLDIVTGDGAVTRTPLDQWLNSDAESGRMPPGVALREARSVIVDDIREEPSLAGARADLLAHAIISAAAIPMLCAGRVVGILKVYHSTVAAMTPERRALLEEVASLLGAFLGRAQVQAEA